MRSYDSDSLKLMMLFESLTGAKVKDYLSDHAMFIIERGDMGKAIGKGGANLRRLEHLLKKQITLVEFHEDMKEFLRNLIKPAEILSIEEKEGVVSIRAKDTRSKGLIYGRERSKLALTTEILKRHFQIKEVKII